MDPFAVLGLEPDLELAETALEQRYLQLSRETHPDHHGTADATEQVAILTRAAQINDAYRALRDRWRRAEALLELRAPGVIEAHKKLDPLFLAEAMELAEAVAEADGDDPALRARAEAERDARWSTLCAAAAADDWPRAATALHEARYFHKAIADLGDKT